MLDGELLYTKILEVNLFAFAYRLFREDFSSINARIFVHICVIHICLLNPNESLVCLEFY